MQHVNHSNTESRFETLFDGTPYSLKNWDQVGADTVTLTDGSLVTSATAEFGLVFYTQDIFGDFILQLEFSLANPRIDNSGVFVRFRDPRLPPSSHLLDNDKFLDISRNRAWIAAYSGFEIQIDEQARGNKRYGEPDGLDKHRTGAIYDIATGQCGEPRMQDYRRPENLQANEWNLYEIEVSRQTYRVRLNGSTTTWFINTQRNRGVHPNVDSTSGYVGVQAYPNSRVAFRNIRAKRL